MSLRKSRVNNKRKRSC